MRRKTIGGNFGNNRVGVTLICKSKKSAIDNQKYYIRTPNRGEVQHLFFVETLTFKF